MRKCNILYIEFEFGKKMRKGKHKLWEENNVSQRLKFKISINDLQNIERRMLKPSRINPFHINTSHLVS